MRWRVLVSAPYMLPVLDRFAERFAQNDVEVIRADVHERLSAAELLPLIQDVDGVICGDDEFNASVLESAPRLRVISKWGTGIDSIDHRAAERLGIRVCRTPDAFTHPVADSVLAYMLTFARNPLRMDREMKQGEWRKIPGVSLGECVLGVVGVGNIGKAVVRRARAFGMRVLGTDRVEIEPSFCERTRIELTNLGDLLERSDFVSLNCDLNPSSRHLMGGPEFETMKTSSYLINTARGGIIDEAALERALTENQIAGAALDVFETEPLPTESPLRRMENCLLAPHNSNSSPRAWERVHENTLENLLDGLKSS